MKYPEGNVKLTFNSFEPTRPESISFKQIIDSSSADGWEFILLSSYCTDYEWLLEQFKGNSPKTDINLIEHYDRTSQAAGIQQVKIKYSINGRSLNLIHPNFPKFPSYGVMHCKLIILASSEFLRIVVSSANLMDYDYEQVQNIVFIQDLPKSKHNTLTASSASFLIECQFYSALNGLLDALGVFHSEKVIMPLDLMQKYDWTKVEASLIYSIPEYSQTNQSNTSGIAMLNRLVKSQKFLRTSTIEYQGSSLGAIKREWLVEFGAAINGELFDHCHSTTPHIKKRTASEIIDLTVSDDETDEEIEFKIIFPTLETVLNSQVGPEGFGTLFCKRKDFESLGNDSSLVSFYDCKTIGSSSCKYAMHSKIMTATSSDSTVSYYYCGSHNFTASAWGKTTKNGSMLMISNFEVGVLLSPKSCSLQYPYARPATKYKQTDFPWDQTQFYSKQLNVNKHRE